MIARALAALAAFFLFSISAEASVTTFRITWSGAEFGNAATARGYIKIDTAAIGTSFMDTIGLPSPAVTGLKVVVSGAGADDGSYLLSDFIWLYFWTPSPLDYSKELIGQPLGDGCVFGRTTTDPCAPESGDFNVFGYTLYGVDFFAFEIGVDGPRVAVTSMMPDLPEPATVALLLPGLAAVCARRRERR